MNEFDHRLETQLRRYLDPVVASRVPVRRLPKDLLRTGVAQGSIELPAVPLVAVPAEVLA
jgi:hypothetical protein